MSLPTKVTRADGSEVSGCDLDFKYDQDSVCTAHLEDGAILRLSARFTSISRIDPEPPAEPIYSARYARELEVIRFTRADGSEVSGCDLDFKYDHNAVCTAHLEDGAILRLTVRFTSISRIDPERPAELEYSASYDQELEVIRPASRDLDSDTEALASQGQGAS